MSGTDRLDAALAVLGLDRTVDRDSARAHYRSRMRDVHPDVDGGDEGRAQSITAAYAVLRRHFRVDGTLPAATPPGPTPEAAWSAPPAPPASPPTVPASEDPLDDEDALVIVAPADDVFVALYDAMQAVGDVTYVDADGGLLEALVSLDQQPPSQLLMTLQGRAHGTEVMFTLTANGNETPPPIGEVVDLVAAQLRGGA